MTCRIRLVLAIHNHQPIGNFEGVCEDAYRDSYSPFLDVLAEYPEIQICLHNSGSLLEWLAAAHPEYVEKVRELVARGQIEILGGAFYEPILACIPARDRVGQITAFTKYLEEMFDATVRGMWVPERVWEQTFTSDIAAAGVEYSILDDYHFRTAGFAPEQLHGYYITEDEGRLLKLFPGSEQLRYTIPFQEPEETIRHLREIADARPGSVVTFGDDGEKFGTWPDTKKHVYEDGWLRRFFDALQSNSDWLKVGTLADAVDNVAPLGRCYLPAASYREMTEWALPTERQIQYRHLVKRHEHDDDWGELRQFLRGGFWRNFRVKYPEAGEMYARMMEVSDRVNALTAEELSPDRIRILDRARTELYRAQCNCSYWHGAFGGLYLPHLRNAVYRHLILADNALEEASGRPDDRWVEIDAADYDLDARKEIRMAGDRMVAYLAPSRGGHLYELDVRSTRLNLLATLDRRPEPYHDVVREAGAHQHEEDHDGPHDEHGRQEAGAASIHDSVRFKQPDLDKKIVYDQWRRKSLVDHFLQPGLELEDFMAGSGRVGDFASGVYLTRLRRYDEGRIETVMTREGSVGPYKVHVEKTIALDVQTSGRLEIRYDVSNLPEDLPIHFGVEFNFAGMAAGAADRYYYDSEGRQLGQLESINVLEETSRIGLIDEWLGVDAALEMSEPASIWTFPIQTISQSEGGFELVHQSSTVIPHWQFVAGADGRWSVTITMAVDTSAAQARRLREPVAAN